MIIKNIQEILNNTESKPGRIFSITIQILIITSLISFSIYTLPDLSESTKKILNIIEIITVTIFTVEYVARALTADKPLLFIFSFFGIIDFIAIAPFYISTGIDLRAVRIFRLLRLFRILKLIKYNQAISRLHEAITEVKEELILFGILAIITLYLSAVGIYYFENAAQPEQFKSVFHSMWWAVTTLTTVGYGDMFPVTTGGKLFTFVVLMIGLGIVAVPTGLIASALSAVRKKK